MGTPPGQIHGTALQYRLKYWIGKQTHRTPQQGAESKLGLMGEAIRTWYPELSPYYHSADNTWLIAGISKAMRAP